MRHLGAKSEGTVGTLLMVGASMTVVGVLASCVLFMAGAFTATHTRTPSTGAVNDIGPANLLPWSFALVGVGIIVFVAGLGLGYWYELKGSTGIPQTYQGVQVIARYGFSKDGHMLSDWEVESRDDVKFYVKLALGEGVMQEFECGREVYYQSGEGMIGAATTQGRWMGSFIPAFGQGVISRPSDLSGL